MRLPLFFLPSFLLLFSFCSCSGSKNEEFQFYLVNLSTKDTVFRAGFNPGDALSFNCPKSVDQTILVASVHWQVGQISTVVPVLPGQKNTYIVSKDLIRGNNAVQSMNQRIVSFSGNPKFVSFMCLIFLINKFKRFYYSFSIS